MDGEDDSEDLPTALKHLVVHLNRHRLSSSNQRKLQKPLVCYGDYGNIRATLGPVGSNDSSFPAQSSIDSSKQGLGSDSSYGCNSSMSTHNVQQQAHHQPHTHNSPFSFKHFVVSGSVPTAPSSTVTSLGPPANITSTTTSANATSSRSLQTSTGARPKVPQSNSVSSNIISSLTVGGSSPAVLHFKPYGRKHDRFRERDLSSNASTVTRRTRRQFGTGSPHSTTAVKLKFELPPLTSDCMGGGGCATGSSYNTSGNSRKNAIRPTDFQPFVQDYWVDTWYPNDIYVNSPPSSPTQRFLEDLAGAGGCQASGGIGQERATHLHNNSGNRALHIHPLPGPADIGDFNIGLPERPSSSAGSKMLPDFLSGGPIKHSSQRSADVAAGLPSNSIGSPEESMNNQLSKLILNDF